MSNAPSVLMSRPSLGFRSISELAPLYDPSSTPQSGSRLRGSKAVSGAHTATGSQLPHSPLLPLPPANSSKPLLRTDRSDAEQTENVEPSRFLEVSGGPGALAARRQARRGVSEGYAFHSHQMKPSHTAMAPSSTLSPKTALRLNIAAASDPNSHPAASKSAGMIRSYSLPVATQEEHDEQQRVMALGPASGGRHTGNPAWWQYGWPSPGGLNHRHVHNPATSSSGGLPQRTRSSQGASSPLSTTTPIDAAASTHVSSSASTPKPTRSTKTHSSCSPKMKNKHLPGIHQHTFKSSSRSASTSPKMGRSPLAAMSTNLPAVDQQHELADEDSKSVIDHEVGAGDTFGIEMDALNQRFADWSRAQKSPEQDDYFNLVHDEPNSSGAFLRAAGGSDTSDEARTPRASSPRPLHKHVEADEDQNRWSGSFDFIHPDHLV